MKNFCLSIVLITLLGSPLLAQPLLNKIPTEVGILAEINLNSLTTNLGESINSLDESIRFPLLAGTRIPARELLNSSLSGINTNGKAYFFVDGENSVWLLPIADEVLFKKTILNNMKPLGEDQPMPRFTKEKGSQMMFVRNHGVTMKKGVAVITEGPYISGYGSYTNSYRVKEELKNFMRSEGITNEDDFVSPSMKKRIKELVDKAEKEEIDKEIEEAKREKERAKRAEKDKNAEDSPLEEAEEVHYLEEVMEAEEAATDAVENAAEIVSEEYDDGDYAKEEAYEEPYYYNWNHPILEAFDEEWENMTERKRDRKYEKEKVKLVESALRYMDLKSSNSIAKNTEFGSKFSSTHDLGLYMDASYPLALQGSKRMYRNLGLKVEDMVGVLKGNVNVLYMDIKDQSLEFTGDQFISEKYSKYQTIKTGAVNTEFLKYLPSTTFGIAAMNFDMNETYNMSFDMYSSMLSTMEIEKGVDISGALDMMDMLINKDMVLNTFSGDALFAVTGMSEYIGTKRTYEYDTVTYESTMKTVADTSTIPEIMAFFTIKNQENFTRFLTALDKLKVIKKVGGVYNIDMSYGYESKDEKRMKALWTMGFEGNLFYVTNSAAAKNANKLPVLNESNKLNPEILALLKTNGNSMYYDHKAGVALYPMEELDSRSAAGMLDMSTKYFHNASMAATKVKDGHYTMNATFNFNKENKTNALLQMLEWMQEMDDRY